MSGVDLSSARDWVQWLNMLPALRVVRLSDCRFSGGVEKTLTHSNLTHIEVLDLSRNSFNFSVHHNWFWGLTSLKELHLSNSEWSGPIPDALGNMSSLQVIDLSQNHILSGNIPRNLASLCDLQILNFEEVNINGDIEKLMERLPKCSWNKLRVLNFYRSNLTGEIPVWIGNLSSLVSLDLSVNELVGHVPIGIGALSNLNYLGLGSNKLSGLLSEEHFAGLVNLDTLDLEDNSLRLGLGEDWVPPFQLLTIGFFRSCDLGPQFPAWLRQAPEIVHLDISNTNIIDRLPDWFWVVFRNAISLFLSNNQISGALPAKLEIESASVLDISNNSLSGTLPVYVTGPQLERLYLSDNYITGNIPAYFCELYSLKELDLSNNELTGGFPQCLKNGSSASDPYSFNHFGSMLEVLDLKNNHLSGELLDNLWSATRLVFLDVSFNKLSGSVPAWIGEKLPLLGVFILRSNMFCGHLPKELMKLEYLHYLDLAHNNISGNIPSSLVDLKTMAIPGGLNYFPESISMFTKHQELHYTLKFKGSAVTLVDLSCNSFIGQIPKELSLLKGLQSLNLSGNQLSGPIPDGIGGLRELESLDISYNGLSGEIPSSLSDLTFLSWLNLSYNNLSGQIPSGKQLQTLNNQYMYIGNPGLCGPPLVNNCSTNERGKNSYEEDEGTARDRSSFYISMSLGFVMGLWMVFCTMMFKEKFRDAYFQMIDNIYDKVYLFFFCDNDNVYHV